MNHTMRQHGLIGLAVGLLLVAVGCGGGSTANGGIALSLTTGGYPDVSGTYQVTDSSCSFATVDDEYDVDQDDAVIDIDRVITAAPETGSPTSSPSKARAASSSVTTITRSGAITLIVDRGTEQFTCTANVALPFIPFSCTSASAICAFTIEQVEAGSSGTGTDTGAPATANTGSASHSIPILEE